VTPDALERIAAVSAAATAAGINPWLAALTLVGLSYLDWIELGPIPGLDTELSDPLVFFAIGVAFLIEQVVDKIPALDHISDIVHLPIKPAVAVGLVLAVAAPGDPSSLGDLAIPLAVAAALVALLSHLGKAGLRAGSTATTGGLANPVLSVLEDLSVVGLIVAAVLVPLLALILAAVALTFAVRGVVKWVRRARAARTEVSPT
jgi:hypothetical protein